MTDHLFVDTGAWFALQVPDDRWHAVATATLRELLRRGYALTTSNLVVGETYTLLGRTHGHAAAWRFLDTLRASTRLDVIHVDVDIEREAYAILRRFADQTLSYVDGASFACMRRRKIQRAFAFDRHFASAGFVRVPVDRPVD